MKFITILKDDIINFIAMWLFFIYGGLSLAGTVILTDSVLKWDTFSVVIGLLNLAYLGFVLLRLIISNIPSVRSRLEQKDTWAVFIARHFYMVSLWLAWVVISLCAVFFCKVLDWEEGIRGVVSTGAGASAILLVWLIWGTIWPMGVWVVKGLGKDLRISCVGPIGEKPWPKGTWGVEGFGINSKDLKLNPLPCQIFWMTKPWLMTKRFP